MNASKLKSWNQSGRNRLIQFVNVCHLSPRSKISTMFNATVRNDSLLRSIELEVATTQDETDAEEMTVPVRIVSHPPPISLTFQQDSSVKDGQNFLGFLLPDFDVDKKRSDSQKNHITATLSQNVPSAHCAMFHFLITRPSYALIIFAMYLCIICQEIPKVMLIHVEPCLE